MKPVSFGSLMAFTVKHNNNYLSEMLKASFTSPTTAHHLNEKYVLVEKPLERDVYDGTAFNATKNVANKLDNKYKEDFRVNPRKVFLTPVKISDRSGAIQTRYFITAATQEDEDTIHNSLSGTNQFLVAKFVKETK